MPKIKNFIWRLLIGALPTSSNLRKRGLGISSFCPICCSEIESLEHLFLECSWVKTVWYGSMLHWSMESNDIYNFKSWFLEKINLIENSGGDDSNFLIALFMNLLWGIWLGRNKAIFDSTSVNPILTIQASTKGCQEYFNANYSVPSAPPPSSSLYVL